MNSIVVQGHKGNELPHTYILGSKKLDGLYKNIFLSIQSNPTASHALVKFGVENIHSPVQTDVEQTNYISGASLIRFLACLYTEVTTRWGN